jgi:hypothetical protein
MMYRDHVPAAYGGSAGQAFVEILPFSPAFFFEIFAFFHRTNARDQARPKY